MGDHSIEYMDTYYEECSEQAYRDYFESSFYEFLFEMKEDCMVPKPYTLLGNTTIIKRFGR